MNRLFCVCLSIVMCCMLVVGISFAEQTGESASVTTEDPDRPVPEFGTLNHASEISGGIKLVGGDDTCIMVLVQYGDIYYRLTVDYDDYVQDILAKCKDPMYMEAWDVWREAINAQIYEMPLSNVEEVTIEPISESGLFELEGCAFRELEDYGFQWVHFETAGLNEDANPILKVNAGFFGYSVILDVTVDEFDEAYRTGDMEAIGNFSIKYVEADDISEDIVNPMYNADGTLKIEEDVVSEDFGE